jgi:Ca2+/Na+ antiporter
VALAIILMLAGALVLAVGATARGPLPGLAARWLRGVSLEGLAVVLVASAEGATSVVAGVAFGIALTVMSLGFATTVALARRPVAAPEPEAVLIPAATLVATAFTLADLMVSRIEGLGLLVVFVASVFLREPFHSGWASEPATSPPAGRHSSEGRGLDGPRLLLSLLLLYVGARVLLAGGDRFFDLAGLQAGFVGAAVVAPAAAARLIIGRVAAGRAGGPEPARRALDAIAGCATGALGGAALIRPVPVDASSAYAFLAVAGAYVIVSVVLLATGRTWRWTGALVLALYGLWLAVASMV